MVILNIFPEAVGECNTLHAQSNTEEQTTHIKKDKKMPEKSFNIRFIATLVIGLACSFASMLLGVNPIFNGACGLAAVSICLVIFGLVKD